MNWLFELLFSSGTAHSILIIALTIAGGILLSKIKIKGISLGIAWVLFVGIALSHFGMRLEGGVEHFAKEFGLILFVYSIGLQVGPGFFSSFGRRGLSLNIMACTIVLLGCVVTYGIHLITGESLTTMVGILSGAVTNTPGLGAAQQTLIDSSQSDPSVLAMGYAVAYPLGVLGIIMSMVVLKNFSLKPRKEQPARQQQESELVCIDIKITNSGIANRSVKDISALINREFIISRIIRPSGDTGVATEELIVHHGEIVRVVTRSESADSIIATLGEKVVVEELKENLVSRRIVVTKESVNGRTVGALNTRANYGVNITRVNRAGVELIAVDELRLQVGDRVTVVGSRESISKVADMMGNSMKRLDHPNLLPIFIGVSIGVLLGSIPFVLPGIPQPIKLGLAGGPLIVAILISRFGHYYKMVTFTTTSANMMLREIGISIFLATVGLGAGEKFIETIAGGGYLWILYGFAITTIPLLIVGTIALKWLKLDSSTLMGLLAGSTTDPPALAYANEISANDKASVSYATVYPLTMFLRVLTAQLLILMALS